MTTLVVSTHLDDAVLSVGGTVSAAVTMDKTVVTVFAGVPPAWHWPSPFDNACGFASSVDAMQSRLDEDRRACGALGVSYVHFGHLDGQYGIDRDEHLIDDQLRALFGRCSRVMVPLGIMHPDHRLVAKLCRSAARARPPGTMIVYADLPGAQLWPSHVPGAVRGWERAGFAMTPWVPDVVDLDVKAIARAEYRSQLRFPELAFENLTEERGWIARYAG